jgi:hypothetical protein
MDQLPSQSAAAASTAGGLLQGAGSILINTKACLQCQQQCKAAGGETQGMVTICTKPTDVIDKCVCLKKIISQAAATGVATGPAATQQHG